MLVAKEKFKTNIVEYILYMFNIEDVIRINKFDIVQLKINIISEYNLPANQLNEIVDWYTDLIQQMQKDDILEAGHLSSLRELMFQLNDLHLQLLNTLDEERYAEFYHWAPDYIKELKLKMNRWLL